MKGGGAYGEYSTNNRRNASSYRYQVITTLYRTSCINYDYEDEPHICRYAVIGIGLLLENSRHFELIGIVTTAFNSSSIFAPSLPFM